MQAYIERLTFGGPTEGRSTYRAQNRGTDKGHPVSTPNAEAGKEEHPGSGQTHQSLA